MNLEKALAIVDAKFSVPPPALKNEFRDLTRRAIEEMFANTGSPNGSGPFHQKDKLNGWINETAEKYLFGYRETLPQAEIENYAALEKQLHTHFLKAMDRYYSEACHTLSSQGNPALVMHLQADYENMKRGKLADISLLSAKLKNEAMKHNQNNVTYNLSGSNARVLINSQDVSINVANSRIILDEVRHAAEGIGDPILKSEVLNEIKGMEASVGKPTEFLPRYTKFISLIANHASLFANLIPALTEFLK